MGTQTFSVSYFPFQCTETKRFVDVVEVNVNGTVMKQLTSFVKELRKLLSKKKSDGLEPN